MWVAVYNHYEAAEIQTYGRTYGQVDSIRTKKPPSTQRTPLTSGHANKNERVAQLVVEAHHQQTYYFL